MIMEIINNSYNGLLVVKAKNGNFNAGFDGNPRTLPNGTIFATDKALKYCIREYLANFGDNKKGEDLIFVRRNRTLKKMGQEEKYAYETLKENFDNKVKILEERKMIDFEKEKLDKDKSILKVLKSFIDIRLFGVVFAVDANISLTGPVQISYGENRFSESAIFSSQILSPYKNSNTKSEDSAQTTIGEETRSDEVYYVYNISVNSVNAKETGMTMDDLKALKKAFLKSVGPITSCTKYGCESVALIWLNNNENLVLNNLSDWVSINRNKNNKIELGIKELEINLKPYHFNGIVEENFSLDYDGSEKEENKNKIQVIYHKGKIEISNE